MAIKYNKVIVFGPTGGVGGAAAVEAHKRGAEVWLAMRDTAKPIPAISTEEDGKGQGSGSNFHRIQADLTNPQSVKEAVQHSQAKAAFIYRVQSADGLKSSVTAMKEAGIEYVVFLSSFSVPHDKPLRSIEPSDAIPYGHAQVEISLEDLGIAHVALRPAQFASNTFTLSLDKSKQPWEALILYGDYKGDAITSLDIGRVGGSALVDRPSAGAKEIIYLCGPKILSQDEQWSIIQKFSPYGKDIKIARPTKEEYITFLSSTLPRPFAEFLVVSQEDSLKDPIYREPLYSQGVANIKKYSGYEPTRFEEFVATYQI